MSWIRSFALSVPALLLATALSFAAPPGIVAPPSTYHYPSGRDFVSPANRTTSNYFVPPQSYYVRPSNPEPNVAPQYPAQSPPGRPTGGGGTLGSSSPAPTVAPQNPPGSLSPYDVPLVPPVLSSRVPLPPEPAEILVRVPEGAEIWFNGEKTRQTGTRRLFSSPPLEPGQRYAYDVKARWTVNGKAFEQTRHVPLTAGERANVTFE